MARKPAYKPQRKDWTEVETVELADGREAVRWMNLITNEQATLLAGTHPMDNPNSINANSVQVLNPAEMISRNVADDPDDAEPDDIDDAQETVDSVMRMLRGGGFSNGRADVKLYRKANDGKLEYCSKYSPEEFLEGGHDVIREQWGPGKYQIILYATNPEGRNYARRAMQEINIATPVASFKPASGSDDKILALMERMDARMTALESRRVDPMEQMTTMFAMMKGMREAMGLDQIQPRRESAPVDPIEQMTKTLTLLDMLRERAEPKSEPDDPLATLGPKALDLLKVALENQQAPQSAQVLPLIQAQPQPQPQPQQPQPQSMDDDDMRIRVASIWIKSQATANVDPSEVAETAFELLPDEILAVIRTDQWFDFLTQIDGSLANHRDYLSRVRDALLKILAEESQSENPEPGPRIASNG